MAPTKDEVLELLDAHERRPTAPGPLELSPAYLRAVERWEGLPENADRFDKSWVARCQRAWKRHFARAQAATHR